MRRRGEKTKEKSGNQADKKTKKDYWDGLDVLSLRAVRDRVVKGLITEREEIDGMILKISQRKPNKNTEHVVRCWLGICLMVLFTGNRVQTISGMLLPNAREPLESNSVSQLTFVYSTRDLALLT